MPPVVNCVLPSGRQMRENNVAESVQEEIREIALQVLKKLLAPIIFLKKGKQVRQQLTAQYLSDTTEKEMLTAAERTFHYISFLTHYTPGLAEDVTRVGATGLVKRGVQEDHSTDASVSVDERDRTQEGGDEEEEGERTPTGDSHATLPSGAILSPNARKIAFATKDDTSNASSPKHKRTQLEPHQLNTIKQAIRDMLRTARRTVRVHNECIQWSMEPAHEVTLLLAGSVRRVFPTLGGENPHTIKPSKPPLGAARESPASLNASRRGSTALGFGSAAGSVPVQFNGTGRRVSMALDALLSTARSNSTVASTPGSQGLRRQSMSSAGKLKSTTAVAWSEEEVEAPSVFGEASSIAGFPYCQQLYVSSPTALLLQVPLSAYARLLAVCPVELQRTCMIAAMAWRQHYLPVFAPLTVSRLRMCPLLTSLKKDQLEGVLTHAVPRSFPAGMICNGEAKASLLSSRPSVVGNTPFSFPQSNNASTSALFANHNPNNAKDEEELVPIKIDSQSIFFVRRGVLRMQREGFSQGEEGSSLCAKNRRILVEGHTFGEINSIFGEAIGECYYAVTHVDLYVLPFQVIIQLMKLSQEVQQSVYRAARVLSNLYEKEQLGVVFNCPDMKQLFQSIAGGVMDRRALLSLYANFNGALGTVNVNTLSPSGPASPLAPGGLSSAQRRSGGGVKDFTSSPPAPRRVTIFEGEVGGGDSGDKNTDGAYVGGRLSEAMYHQLLRTPLLSLFECRQLVRDSLPYWKCYRVERGETVVKKGEECNRLLFFAESRVGVLQDEKAFCAADTRQEDLGGNGMSPFASLADAPGVVPLPAGHIVGYTCVRRHRWRRSLVALEDAVEVWELKRSVYVSLLQKYKLDHAVNVAALQLLQPLYPMKERVTALDFQPLLRPMPNSLWTESAVPLLHPVSTADHANLFPIWKEGRFSIVRRTASFVL
ncbi:hypothetical protein ADEAN_000360300 [Angomonas deanei]|uniref:Cyclic nucleotide-binding domain-containing protein n=1 Tax=Angomonas deanei TaxID=59799 RepID=A0A7G2CDD6_9TRYP|nr:hypothetical protein ADEAN_000360300 [Angomonas deanei]